MPELPYIAKDSCIPHSASHFWRQYEAERHGKTCRFNKHVMEIRSLYGGAIEVEVKVTSRRLPRQSPSLHKTGLDGLD